jgi:hypothetical protein
MANIVQKSFSDTGRTEKKVTGMHLIRINVFNTYIEKMGTPGDASRIIVYFTKKSGLSPGEMGSSYFHSLFDIV